MVTIIKRFQISVIFLCFFQIALSEFIDPVLRQSVMASVWARVQFQEGFASSTRVKIQNGYKNIQDLVIGDCIGVPGTDELQEVVFIESRLLRYYYAIKLDQGNLQVAPAQKIYDVCKNVWIEAQDLTLQDHVGVYPIVSVQKIEQYMQLYKLHTSSHIFELEGDIVVHNFDVALACSAGLIIGQLVVQHPVLALIGRTVSLTKLAMQLYEQHKHCQQQAIAFLDALIVQDVVIEARNYYEIRRKQLIDLLVQYQAMQQVAQAVIHKSVLGVSIFSTTLARGPGIALLPALQTELQYTASEKHKLLIARQQDLVVIEKEIIDIQLSMVIYFDGLLGMYDVLLADIDKLVKEFDQITELWDLVFIDRYSLSDLLYMSIKNLTFLDLYVGLLENLIQDLSFFMNFCQQNNQAIVLRQTSNIEQLCLQVRTHTTGTLQYLKQFKISIFNLQQINYELLQEHPEINQDSFQDFVHQAQQQLQNQNQQHKANIKIKQSQIQFTAVPDDPDENNNKKRRIYEEVDYHHKNSVGGKQGGKSPSPKNGQRALDFSIPFNIKGSGSHFYETRLSVEDNYFVVLMEHRPGYFHGHLRLWDDLHQDMQNALYDAGIIKNRKTGRM